MLLKSSFFLGSFFQKGILALQSRPQISVDTPAAENKKALDRTESDINFQYGLQTEDDSPCQSAAPTWPLIGKSSLGGKLRRVPHTISITGSISVHQQQLL